MKTRTGKIARLPKPIREQLNQRLENGELGTSLVQWLNQLPEVQKIITELFAGKPIRPQNLSEWRKGGYLDWLRHQLLREQTRWVAEQSADLRSDSNPQTISIAEDIAMVLSAELALHVQALGDIADPKKRFEQFRHLCRELSRLRRDDQRAIRTNHRREQWTYDHPLRNFTEPKKPEVISPKPYIPTIDELNRLRLARLWSQSATPQNPESSSPQPAPIPARPSSDSVTTGGDESPTSSFCILPSALPEAGALRDAPRIPEATAERASVPECGSPLPLSQSEPKPENSIPKLEPANPQLETPNPKPEIIAEKAPYNPPLPALPSPLDPRPSILPNPSAPIRPNPHRNYYDPRPPIRGRRFVCLEG